MRLRRVPRQSRARRIATWLAMVGIVFRVLIPPGFMLEPPSAGLGTNIVICTGSGSLRTITVDFGGRHDDGSTPAKHHDGEVCSFASVTPFAAGPVFTVPPADLAHAIVQASEPDTVLSASRPDVTLRGPRAPPFGVATLFISKARTTV